MRVDQFYEWVGDGLPGLDFFITQPGRARQKADICPPRTSRSWLNDSRASQRRRGQISATRPCQTRNVSPESYPSPDVLAGIGVGRILFVYPKPTVSLGPLAYVDAENLCLRDLADGPPRRITSGHRIAWPTFPPSGHWIALQDGKWDAWSLAEFGGGAGIGIIVLRGVDLPVAIVIIPNAAVARCHRHSRHPVTSMSSAPPRSQASKSEQRFADSRR